MVEIKSFDEIPEERIAADILIIGGGTAGCLAAVEAKEKNPSANVVIIEKAHVDRSGCLAAGMNALNLYLHPGETPESFVRYVRFDAFGLIREDLSLSMAKEVNPVVKRVESWGLPIIKDDRGEYLQRGRWNLRVHGESLKPIIARAAKKAGARVLNRVAATNLIVSGNQVVGAMGFGVRDGKFYVIQAKATIVTTGGAAGIYKPNAGGQAHHHMWYSPFNTGAGYAMGIRAGAEMTSFEMRFVALRIKDVLSPTGTLALGFGAPQVNSRGERFMVSRFSHMGGERAPTALRVYGPVSEIKEGRGPCFLDTRHLNDEQVRELKENYLDMYPETVLYWTANKFNPAKEPVEIQGTEPYVVGGHCQAGYWIDALRRTTLKGLYAAGDVAGGSPYKFVSGCWAEAVIATRAALQDLTGIEERAIEAVQVDHEKRRIYQPFFRFQKDRDGVTSKDMEARLQKIMDDYAGGISSYYEMNDERLEVALRRLANLRTQVPYLVSEDLHHLMQAHEVVDRLDVAEVLVNHLLYRKETRWPGFQTRLDYPHRDDWNWLKFVNSVRSRTSGEIEMLERPYEQMVPGDRMLPR